MKIKIMNLKGASQGELELPSQFSEPVREDLVKKAFLTVQNNSRQAYGSYELAGMRHSVEVSKRRKDYRGSYGKGISRVPRKVLSRRGSQFFWVGAQSPGTVGGRRAHPPKAEKIWGWKLNVKEKRKAIRSALSATVIKELVEKRGHLIPENYPFVVDDQIQSITKTKELYKTLELLGFKKELERANVVKVRAGRGKMRGRSKTVKKSLLIVVTDTSKILQASSSIPGVDVIHVRRLNADCLAPGGHVGRAAIFTSSAVEELSKGLFTNVSNQAHMKAQDNAGAKKRDSLSKQKNSKTPVPKQKKVVVRKTSEEK